MKINYAGPDITEEDAEYVKDAVLNGFYENYKKHTEILEAQLCEYLGVKHALATNSATAALHLSLACLELKPGDEIITTNSSCVASAMPIAYEGLNAKFVDVKTSDWNLDPIEVEKNISSNTKAIIAVHWNGHPCDMNALQNIALNNNITLIEDAAPALGAEINGKKVGSIGDMGCFSFQGAKIAIGGQGGAIVTNNSDLFKKIKILASYGRTDSQMQYWSDFIGWNYTMPNLPAALASSQLKRIDSLLLKKERIFNIYREKFRASDCLRLIENSPGTKSTYCYPCIQIDPKAMRPRAEIINELNSLNIDARPAQPQISNMPMFNLDSSSPNSKIVEDYGLILPSAFNLSEKEVEFVSQSLLDLVES
ncbi:DegT/DnrJ/EryC1/StrS family aminotransferase [Gammaproteobacteria bacterium]|nr:DegT/DnrJ/EryC1/StrS family aminotransferase [Gammaproteobacteria bacterium]